MKYLIEMLSYLLQKKWSKISNTLKKVHYFMSKVSNNCFKSMDFFQMHLAS